VTQLIVMEKQALQTWQPHHLFWDTCQFVVARIETRNTKGKSNYKVVLRTFTAQRTLLLHRMRSKRELPRWHQPDYLSHMRPVETQTPRWNTNSSEPRASTKHSGRQIHGIFRAGTD